MFEQILNFELLVLKHTTITLGNVLLLLLILFATSIGIKILKKIVLASAKNVSSKKGVVAFYNIIKYIIWIAVIILSLDVVGFDITLLIASSTALFVGIGLGLQQIFNDFVSGFFLLFERSIEEGDIVEVDGKLGKVQKINLRTSLISTPDNIIMIVPNSKFISHNMINWSHNEDRTRFKVSVGVAYGSDVKLVMQILRECLEGHERILKKPEPVVLFHNFGSSSLDFDCLFWTDELYSGIFIKSEIRVAIDAAFRKAKIEIPFPQRDVHIKNSQ